jgi:hypothetical protein
MTEYGLDIKTISTKRADLQTDRVLLLIQVTEKQETATPSHFLKFLLASSTNGTFGFARHPEASGPTLRKTKRAVFLPPHRQ